MTLTGNQLPPHRTNLDAYFRGQGLEEDPDNLGMAVSNDTGYEEIRPFIKEAASVTEGQMGVFIGSGGMLSVMPDLKLAYPILMDIDPRVTDFNQTLAELISAGESPEDVLSQVREIRYPYAGDILEEAEVYGEDHWTNPKRFVDVKTALESSPPTFVQADVTDPRLAGILQTVTRDTGASIGYANFTNVHRWLRRRTERPEKFLKYWPVKDDALIVYSDYLIQLAPLRMTITSKDKYPKHISAEERLRIVQANLAARAILVD